jgi:hypothetical protein
MGTGSLYSSTKELYLFNKGLFEWRLIKSSSLERMLSPSTKEGNASGCFTGIQHGRKAIWHQGGIFDYLNFIQYYRKKNYSFLDSEIVIVTDYYMKRIYYQKSVSKRKQFCQLFMNKSFLKRVSQKFM